MHDAMTHEQVMELVEGNMIRVKVFYPNEPTVKRVAFVDKQSDGIVEYHLWNGQPGRATHGDIFVA